MTDQPDFPELSDSELLSLRNSFIKYFYHRVCVQAEKNMQLTGTVSGAHWNAMRQVLQQMNIDIGEEQAG